MNKIKSQTLTPVAILLIMAVCSDSESREIDVNIISKSLCIEPVLSDHAPRNEQADSFNSQVEKYRSCIAENVDFHNQAIKEHRQKLSSMLLKWKVFAESCNDSKSCLFKLNKVGGKTAERTNESARNIELKESAERKTEVN